MVDEDACIVDEKIQFAFGLVELGDNILNRVDLGDIECQEFSARIQCREGEALFGGEWGFASGCEDLPALGG